MMLFSHGVESVGLVPIEGRRSLIGRARRHCSFIGVDAQAYPRDFAVFMRYHTRFPKKITARYLMLVPLTLSQLDALLKETEDRYQVRWIEDVAPQERRQVV